MEGGDCKQEPVSQREKERTRERDGLWILMWLSWLDTALGLENDRQTDISSWYAIIRCDELYHVQIPLSLSNW